MTLIIIVAFINSFYVYTLYLTDTVIIGQLIQQTENNIEIFVMNKLFIIQTYIQNFIVNQLAIFQTDIQIHIENLIVVLQTDVCEKIARIEEKLDRIYEKLCSAGSGLNSP